MKDFVLSMMSAMMPYMIYVFYLAVVLAIAGLVLFILNIFNGGSMSGLLRLVGKTLLWVSVFYFACELTGAWLGAAPSINLGDENKFEFILVRFWMLGVASLVIGLVYLLLGNRNTSTIEA